ncbi:cell surface glycoprotein CD200 receptor 1-like isoform X1 [Poecilia latipinna]|uniref:cell surface glycoprotein CD200 receptor 1-like isoform X1 n=1 Tax=Poecilia latipinna TaxID=48699 RepID=UPI00072E0E39|nr:PREDICTED: cell surface glycoprotein CD200 receptor 1-like isoform X1 [Poecilia latipinna]
MFAEKRNRRSDMMWIYILIFLLTGSRGMAQGTTNSNIIVNTTTSPLKVYVNRNEAFNLGSDARLICSNKIWTKAVFVIWDIELKHKTCKISFNHEGQSSNSCNDGKSLQNSTDQSFLHIPNFSVNDVGVYKCESTYTGGNENYNITVGVTAPPVVSAWLERRGNKMVAVCRAERGIPAANISWSVTGNQSVTQQNNPDGVVTVESQLEVPEDIDRENLTCIVRHQLWERERTLVPDFLPEGISIFYFIPVFGIIFILVAGFSIYALKKEILLRQCQPTDSPKLPPQTEDVEEVEPYASYVQRVNSIYN